MKRVKKGVPASSRPTKKAKATDARPAKAENSRKTSKAVRLLAGGNPQIAKAGGAQADENKADGERAVQAYIASMPGWKSAMGARLDALITRAIPAVSKAVKWNSPFYGVKGGGYFLSFHVFTRYVKVAFFKGASLRPVPPGPSKQKDARYLDIHEDDELDESQFVSWVEQAAALPGWLSA